MIVTKSPQLVINNLYFLRDSMGRSRYAHDREQTSSARDNGWSFLQVTLGRSRSALITVSIHPQLVTTCCLYLERLWGAQDPHHDHDHVASARDSLQFEFQRLVYHSHNREEHNHDREHALCRIFRKS